jgi:hypothetical protein
VPEIPQCANFLERLCPRSDTFVEREGDSFFTIRCRTCNGINVFPKDRDENRGRYDAFLKRQLAESEQARMLSRQRLYSIPGTRPGEK